MKFCLATIAAAAACLPFVNAHLIMSNPGTFKGGDPMPPLAADGSNFPCTTLGDGGNGETYAPGSTQSIRLTGTAVHSGGSCQISFTYDNPPNRNSVWKVVKSFHGSCPIKAGGNLDPNLGPLNPLPPLKFVVPSDLPSGPAVVAWTWFNKSGNREMYMRCAKVKIGGNNNDRSPFNRLPNMFVANINNGCRTNEGTEIAFPNPGGQIEGNSNGKPVGNCGPSGPSAPPQQPPQSSKPPAQQNPKPPAPAPAPSGGCGATGAIVCNGSNQWSMCVNGKPVFMGSVALGTTCKNGAIFKRNVRFSPEHLNRN